MKKTILSLAVSVTTLLSLSSNAAQLDAALQAKVDDMTKQVQAWAADPTLVNAVKAHNTALPAEYASMTNDQWKGLTILDPLVRNFSKNEAGQFLKAKKGEVVSEAFLSGSGGMKVAFLSKPTSWSHKGSPKHEQPMTGKTWQGPVEVDDSSGLQQVQISVAVLDGGKPIGSLVVGLSLDKLQK